MKTISLKEFENPIIQVGFHFLLVAEKDQETSSKAMIYSLSFKDYTETSFVLDTRKSLKSILFNGVVENTDLAIFVADDREKPDEFYTILVI